MKPSRVLMSIVLACLVLSAGYLLVTKFSNLVHPKYVIIEEDGLTVSAPSIGGSSEAAVVAGVLELDQRGCWSITADGQKVVVVWPSGTKWTDGNRKSVDLDSGLTLRPGDEIKAGGGYKTNADRSSVSVAPDVHCLQTPTINYTMPYEISRA